MIAGFKEKLGFWSQSKIHLLKSKKNWIWIHAVSVGEINAAWPLILKIKDEKPNYPIMLSCTTKNGYNLAEGLIKRDCNGEIMLFYFPFDIPSIVKSFFNRANIKLLILIETEIWPFTIQECSKRNIPIVIVNARLSDKSFNNYKTLKFYFKNIFSLITKVLAQSEEDSHKFKTIGTNSKSTVTLGNIKFSAVNNGAAQKEFPTINENKLDLNLIFASTHRGEEEIAIKTYKTLIDTFQYLRLVIAPRHIERTNEVIEIVRKNNFIPILRTESKKIQSNREIFILNTIGELALYYKVCPITVLGGTFSKIGGHNIIEPIKAGSYTIIGPYDYKIKELSRQFKEKEAIIQVKNIKELRDRIKEYIENKEILKQQIKNGLKVIEENKNVLEQTAREIYLLLQEN